MKRNRNKRGVVQITQPGVKNHDTANSLRPPRAFLKPGFTTSKRKSEKLLPNLKALLYVCCEFIAALLAKEVRRQSQSPPSWQSFGPVTSKKKTTFGKSRSKENQGEVRFAWCLCSRGTFPPVLSARRGEKVLSLAQGTDRAFLHDVLNTAD